jgi:PPOX class probable F420-dependent enzyme
MLKPRVKELAQGRNFALVSTAMPDGSIQTTPLWVDADDEHLLLNTEVHRQRYKNLQKDPHVTVTIVEDGNWYSYVEVRGHLDGEVLGAEARAHIDELSRRYLGGDYAAPIQSERVILKVAPDRQNVR